ncbi:hypothetical protein JXO59_08225, partial [candidate division KSB1 bacterium]|nr:hypothetical protein [candidate division KSB1 bacterium]
EGRGVLINCKRDIHILDDTYDATPQSLMKSTKSLLAFRDYSKRLVLIMGDMAELGKQSKTMHEMMGHYLAAMPIDLILLIGKKVQFTAKAIKAYSGEKKNVQEFSSMAKAQQWLLNELESNDTILIEGSDKEDMAGLVKHLIEKL